MLLSPVLALWDGEPTFWCPGCQMTHRVHVSVPNAGGQRWGWNGDVNKPTFSPSILVTRGKDHLCHSFVQDGKIEFLGDSTHALARCHVDLPPIPAEELDS